MSKLPPLPLIDGAFFIDNSSLELLQGCPRAFEYNKLFKRISSAGRPALDFGTAIHSALEWRYKNCRNEAPTPFDMEEIANVLQKHFDEHPAPDDDWRNLNLAVELIRRYNAKFAHEPFNILVNENNEPLVELSFALPLFEHKMGDVTIPVFYTGRIDLPVHWDNALIVIDHKTTSILGDHFFAEHKMSAQPLGYCWAFEQMGYKVNGFCINALRTREMPNYVAEGKSFRGTSPEKWWDESLQRDVTYIRPGQLDEWRINVQHLIEEFFYHYSKNYLPMKTRWCVSKYGKCQYYDVCSLPKEQRELLLSSNMFTDNTWSPLTTTTNQETK